MTFCLLIVCFKESGQYLDETHGLLRQETVLPFDGRFIVQYLI